MRKYFMFPVQDDEHTEFALLYLLNRLTVSNSTCMTKELRGFHGNQGEHGFFLPI